jgi:hypothetical protein
MRKDKSFMCLRAHLVGFIPNSLLTSYLKLATISVDKPPVYIVKQNGLIC